MPCQSKQQPDMSASTISKLANQQILLNTRNLLMSRIRNKSISPTEAAEVSFQLLQQFKLR